MQDHLEAIRSLRSRADTSVSHALYRSIETPITPRTVWSSVAMSAGGSRAILFSSPAIDCVSLSEFARDVSLYAVVISYSNSTCLP